MDFWKTSREATAITRYFHSVPFQLLAKAGFLTSNFTILDYGCGRGDDARIAWERGIEVKTWDPFYQPESKLLQTDIVNLGFVINVIEDPKERDATLVDALEHSNRLLVVSAMLANEASIEKFKPYGDGIITSIGTFQKYYTQESLRDYIKETLELNPVALGQGVFGVFKDDALEYKYLESKYRRHADWSKATKVKVSQEEKIQRTINQNEDLLEEYWALTLSSGRFPLKGEFAREDEVKSLFQSHTKLHSNLLHYFGHEVFESAEKHAKEDMILIQAMSIFTGRRIFKHLPDKTQFEIKHFFGNISSLKNEAMKLLSTLGQTELIQESSASFFKENHHGFLEEGKSYLFHKDMFDRLPVNLRAYVGCALQLYGDLEPIHLLKIHFHTGKLSLMGYDEFDTSPIPMLRERIKINLWKLRVEYFDYIDEFSPKPLYWKSRFLSEEEKDFKKQKSFDDKLDLYGMAPENPSFGPDEKKLQKMLHERGLQIKGYRFYKA